MTDAAAVQEIARGLSKAQREVIPMLSEEWRVFAAGEIDVQGLRGGRFSLIQSSPTTARGRHKFRLTPLGQQVRAILTEEQAK